MKLKTHTLRGVVDITTISPDWHDMTAHSNLNLHNGATYAVEDFFKALEDVDDEQTILA